MTSSKVLLCLCLAFIVGIFFGSIFKISQNLIWAFLFFAIILISFGVLSFPRKRESREHALNPGFPIKLGMTTILGFCILFLCLGILRIQISLFNIEKDKLSKLNDNGDQVTLMGVVSNEPDNRDTVQRLKVKIEKFNSVVLVTKNRYPEYNYLDKIKITGKLKTPMETEDFSYRKYLLKDDIYSVLDFPKTELLQKGSANFYTGVLWLKQKLRESIRQSYSPPESLILEGTILGDSGALTEDLKNKLNITGLRHIIAVSGTHIVILSSIIMSLLLGLGMWRNKAFYVSVSFIWFYIILTGLPASGVRAGIMATLFLLAQKIGRHGHKERIIVIAGMFILLQNPLLLFYDVGFQLSFLAVLGLIYLDPFIKNVLLNVIKKIRKIEKSEKIRNFVGMFSATISAQIFTVPIMLYNFGNVSLIAPITNILILPVVEPLMILGFLSSFTGMFSTCLPLGMGVLGFIFSLPCYCFLFYFLKILDIFSQPWAMKVFENIHWFWLIILYFIIGVFVWRIKKWEKQNNFY